MDELPADARTAAAGGREGVGHLPDGGERLRVVSRLRIGGAAVPLLLHPPRDGLPDHGEADGCVTGSRPNLVNWMIFNWGSRIFTSSAPHG